MSHTRRNVCARSKQVMTISHVAAVNELCRTRLKYWCVRGVHVQRASTGHDSSHVSCDSFMCVT